MRATKLLLASALTVGLAVSLSARPAAASVLYTVDGGADNPKVNLQFETDTFISIPYAVTDWTACEGCSLDPHIIASTSIPGVALVQYHTTSKLYVLDFSVANFGSFGSYSDYYAGESDTLTVSEVPEPASLALLAGGLLALGFLRRRGPGYAHEV